MEYKSTKMVRKETAAKEGCPMDQDRKPWDPVELDMLIGFRHMLFKGDPKDYLEALELCFYKVPEAEGGPQYKYKRGMVRQRTRVRNSDSVSIPDDWSYAAFFHRPLDGCRTRFNKLIGSYNSGGQGVYRYHHFPQSAVEFPVKTTKYSNWDKSLILRTAHGHAKWFGVNLGYIAGIACRSEEAMRRHINKENDKNEGFDLGADLKKKELLKAVHDVDESTGLYVRLVLAFGSALEEVKKIEKETGKPIIEYLWDLIKSNRN